MIRRNIMNRTRTKTVLASGVVSLVLSAEVAIPQGQQNLICGNAAVFTTTGATADGFGPTEPDAEDAANAALKALMLTEWGGRSELSAHLSRKGNDPVFSEPGRELLTRRAGHYAAGHGQ
jgi:hypothetical protein